MEPEFRILHVITDLESDWKDLAGLPTQPDWMASPLPVMRRAFAAVTLLVLLLQTADAKVQEITGKDDFKKTIISSQVRAATPPVPRPAHT